MGLICSKHRFIAATAVLYGLVGPTQAQTFQEYSLSKNLQAGAIVPGPEGALWYGIASSSESTQYEIGKITTGGAVTLSSATPFCAGGGEIAVGSDGAIWVAAAGSHRISRITTAGSMSCYDTPSDPRSIAVGPDGAFWYTSDQEKIGRITTSGTVTEFSLPSGVIGAGAITTGPDGALWFTEPAVQRIGRMSTSGAVTEFQLPRLGKFAVNGGIATGPDGNLWFTVSTGIGRTTPAGVVSFFPNSGTSSSTSQAYNMVAGPGSALWFSQALPGAIAQVTTGGVLTSYPLPSPQSTASGVAVGPDGAVWFSEGTTQSVVGSIGRMDISGVPGGWTVAGVDGSTRIFWRSSAGHTVVSTMNGAAIQSSTYLATLPQTWQIAGIGDFLANGKPGILWRDLSNGSLVMSLTDGASITSSTFLASLPLSWQIVGVADFNGDGKADILWRDINTGLLVVSLLDGASIVSSTVLASVPMSWTVVGVGKFDADARADILWRDNTTGNVVVSLMTGTPTTVSIASSTFVATLPLTWQVAGIGDFNGDGKADILWRDLSNGNLVVSLMSGISITSSTFLATLPLSWQVAGVGDFNADGKGDILWRDTSGNLVVSLVNSTTITSSTFVANLP